jgi:hypothetical protein
MLTFLPWILMLIADSFDKVTLLNKAKLAIYKRTIDLHLARRVLFIAVCAILVLDAYAKCGSRNERELVSFSNLPNYERSQIVLTKDVKIKQSFTTKLNYNRAAFYFDLDKTEVEDNQYVEVAFYNDKDQLVQKAKRRLKNISDNGSTSIFTFKTITIKDNVRYVTISTNASESVNLTANLAFTHVGRQNTIDDGELTINDTPIKAGDLEIKLYQNEERAVYTLKEYFAICAVILVATGFALFTCDSDGRGKRGQRVAKSRAK